VSFTLILRLAIRAYQSKMTSVTSGVIGLTGKAQTAIAPQGTIFVRGELWRARSQNNIAPGQPVRVTGLEGLTLDVVAVEHEEGVSNNTSAVDL
jgi:membrane-bound serine protease (ClpP class)